VKSLHDFVRKTDLTFDEWGYAIDFLTRTGQKCTSTRQEFILLSDVLGVSMLVDAVNHRERDGATETTVLGPFYVGEHKPMPHGTDISAANLTGERMFVQSRVTDLKGKPLAGVPVDVWHADDDGFTIRKSHPTKPRGRQRGRGSSPTPTAGFLPHHPALQLSDPDRRSRRGNDPADAASSDASGACAFSRRCAGLRAADHPRLYRGRQVP